MPSVVLYGTRFCPYCVGARLFLRQRGVAFEDIGILSHMLEEVLVMERGVDRHLYEGGDVLPEFRGIQNRRVAPDVSPLFQLAEPVARRRQRQSHQLGQLVALESSVFLQRIEDEEIKFVCHADLI